MDREELIEKAKIINDKISELDSEEKNLLWKIRGEKERELRILRKPIYELYIQEFPIRNGNWIKSIKHPIKKGIIAGLGIKYLNLINEHDLIKVVKTLIKEDLEKTREKDILLELEEIDKKLEIIETEINIKRKKLIKEANDIYYKLHKKEIDKERRIEKEKEKIKDIVDNHLKKYIKNIRDEITKRLLINELK